MIEQRHLWQSVSPYMQADPVAPVKCPERIPIWTIGLIFNGDLRVKPRKIECDIKLRLVNKLGELFLSKLEDR